MVTAGAGLCVLTVWLVGCQASPPVTVATARAAFAAGDFERAYRDAAHVSLSRRDALGAEAAYLAGMSAYRLRRLGSAKQYLRIAADSDQVAVTGNALAMLGMIHVGQGRYDRASEALLAAAERVDGQDRANAYFYAAVAEQKLQRWANARAYLTLARQLSGDEAFRQRAAAQLRQTGWAIQLGTFDTEAQAQAAADQLATNPRLPNIGSPTVARIVDRDGDPKYVVRCGQFSTFTTAAAKRRELSLNDAVVTPIPVPGE